MATLTISFNGICTHFRGVIPYVPHRVVLPNALTVRFGTFTVPGAESNYCLLPHFPRLSSKTDSLLKSGSLIDSGWISKPVRITVNNATDAPPVQYGSTYAQVPRLTRYVASYQPSSDVVTGARAVCHFDLFAGTMNAEEDAETHAIRVKATVFTNGAPSLSVFPLQGGEAAETLQFEDRDTTLEVWNAELQGSAGGKCDFLLHYLTGSGGIPHALAEALPGMDDLTPLGPADLSQILSDLAQSAQNGWPYYPNPPQYEGPPCHDSPSCSNSTYP